MDDSREVKAQIKQIQEQLKQLRIDASRTISSLENKLALLTHEENERATVNSKGERWLSTNYTGHNDRYGTRIHKGDTVEFLTKGKNKTDKGIVSRASKSLVYSTDRNGNEIQRASKNLRVIKKRS